MEFEMVKFVAELLRDKKATNIIALDVRGLCSITDAFVIAEGTVDRHVKALAQEVIGELAKRGLHPVFTEGEATGDWIVLDYVDFMVHLFVPTLRDKYRLEELWGAGQLIPLTSDQMAAI
jgi:ribosome-associated protein